jgi:tRNA pseudouridine38-40 synthase
LSFKRIALAVNYDGSAYHGWQHQEGELPTVQYFLEKALSRVANHPVNVTCAGRTDSGVHATGQVVHFDTEAERTDYSWVFGTNSNLPPDISVVWAKNVALDFHARFSALGRRYRYILLNQEVRPSIFRNYVGWHHKSLDVAQMQEAASLLIGEHDFSAFRGANCQAKTAVRKLQELTVKRKGRMVVLEAFANGFLLHMVRNLVGSLIEVGMGVRDPIWMKEVLESRDRRNGGITFSPSGLYLVHVEYPTVFELPKTPSGPFFIHHEVDHSIESW